MVKCPSCDRKGTYSSKHKQCSACGLGYGNNAVSGNKAVSSNADVSEKRNSPVSRNVAVSGGSDTKPRNTPVPRNSSVSPGEVCPTCGEQKRPTVQDHLCDDECQKAEHKSIRCMLQIAPEPGEDCALCDERKPKRLSSSERVKAWREKNR